MGLTTEPNAKNIMRLSGLEFAAASLMKKQDTSVELQRLSGSLITLLTSMPVTSEISDEKTASYGHVNIVLPRPSRMYRPDQTLLELDSGVQPSATSVGDFMQSPDIDA